MAHQASANDIAFRNEFEMASVSPESFDHRAHLRVAYTCLCEMEPEQAFERFTRALENFLDRHGIDPSRYHATRTKAWILAVHHFMFRTPRASSFEAFIGFNSAMLDTGIMMTHYSEACLHSDAARLYFVEPDKEPIPRHGAFSRGKLPAFKMHS